jgi:hypothetical protein
MRDHSGNIVKPEPGSGHPLATLKSLSVSSAAALHSRWISTVEQFVAAVATPNSRVGICRLLDVDDQILDGLLNDARLLLGTESFEQLMNANPGGPLGALFDNPPRVDDPDHPRGGNAHL